MLIIEGFYQPTLKIYAFLVSRTTGQYWNNSTSAFESYSAGNYALYAIPLTETSPGYYFATRPSGLQGAIVSDVIYLQNGASPVIGDTLISLLHGQGDNISAINSDTVSPVNLQLGLDTETVGTVASGSITQTGFSTTLLNVSNSAYVGMTIRFTSGVNAGIAGLISGYTSAGGVISLLVGFPSVPAVGDAFIIV